MSTIGDSLQANKDEILKTLPEEFHEDFHAAVAKAKDTTSPSPEDELEAVKAELIANPDVDHEALIPQVESDPGAHRAEPLPTAEEQELAMKAALANVGELVAPEDQEAE